MIRKSFSRSVVTLACGLALGFGASACDRTEREADLTNETVGTSGMLDRDEERPVVLTGCVQKEDEGLGSAYLLVSDEASARTPGAPAAEERMRSEAAPQERQLDIASRTYRLEGHDEELDALIGKRVQVNGTLQESSDLASMDRPGEREAVGTSGRNETGTTETPDLYSRKSPGADERGLDLGTGDLAELQVTSITEMGGACSTQDTGKRQ